MLKPLAVRKECLIATQVTQAPERSGCGNGYGSAGCLEAIPRQPRERTILGHAALGGQYQQGERVPCHHQGSACSMHHTAVLVRLLRAHLSIGLFRRGGIDSFLVRRVATAVPLGGLRLGRIRVRRHCRPYRGEPLWPLGARLEVGFSIGWTTLRACPARVRSLCESSWRHPTATLSISRLCERAATVRRVQDQSLYS